MKTTIIIFILVMFRLTAIGCDVCTKNQPEALQNITHGTGPAGNWDLIIISIAAVIVFITLILSIKYLVKPDEKNPNHIKNIVNNPNF